jgi:4-amino-4-deoxy-L-arabinose transferase-like glycosyltransferase
VRRSVRFSAAVVVLSLLAALQGLVYIPYVGPYLGDSETYMAPARALLDGGYSTPLGPVDVTGLQIPAGARTAPERQTYRTPGYPLLIAATGGGDLGWKLDVLLGAQAVLIGLATALAMLTLRRIWDERLALLGGAFVALDPFTKHYVPRVLSEVLAIFLFAAGAYCFARAWQERSWPWWGAFGLTAAALTLTRPLFVFVIPLGVLAALARQDLPRRRLGAAAATAVCAGALLAPWLAWTQAATGRFVVSSFGEGWNLLIAAHGEGLHRTAVQVENDPAYVRDFTSVHRFAPAPAKLGRYPAAHPRYLARAESEQRRRALDLYRSRIQDEPLTVAGEIGYRAYFLWMVHEDWIQPSWLVPLLKLADWLALGLALIGTAIGLRRDGITRAFALFLLAFTALSALHHVEARYAIPVRSLFLAFVALGLAATLRWTHERMRRQQ